MISCYYETHMLKGGQRVVIPFRSHMIVRNLDGLWKSAAIANSVLLYLQFGSDVPARASPLQG